ncbi:Hypothetical protein PBC10988_33290 [Planctomycetales bacterium 10988]|nr:Hypothetical protein PBC10988_33290 [Planctomycetales bacterium 10988]
MFRRQGGVICGLLILGCAFYVQVNPGVVWKQPEVPNTWRELVIEYQDHLRSSDFAREAAHISLADVSSIGPLLPVREETQSPEPNVKPTFHSGKLRSRNIKRYQSYPPLGPSEANLAPRFKRIESQTSQSSSGEVLLIAARQTGRNAWQPGGKRSLGSFDRSIEDLKLSLEQSEQKLSKKAVAKNHTILFLPELEEISIAEVARLEKKEEASFSKKAVVASTSESLFPVQKHGPSLIELLKPQLAMKSSTEIRLPEQAPQSGSRFLQMQERLPFPAMGSESAQGKAASVAQEKQSTLALLTQKLKIPQITQLYPAFEWSLSESLETRLQAESGLAEVDSWSEELLAQMQRMAQRCHDPQEVQYRADYLQEMLQSARDWQAPEGTQGEEGRIRRHLVMRWLETSLAAVSCWQARFDSFQGPTENWKLLTAQPEGLPVPFTPISLKVRTPSAIPQGIALDHINEAITAWESEPSPENSEQLALSIKGLHESERPNEQNLGRILEDHYRNHNLRVTLHIDLLRRGLPQAEKSQQPVRERLAGIPVRGTAWTDQQLDLTLQPHPNQLRMVLMARGEILSNTQSFSPPVTAYSFGRTTFQAETPLQFSVEGWKIDPTQVSTHNNSQLRSMRSEYDQIPIVGDIVQNMARRRHAELRSRVRWEAEWKSAQKVEAQINERIEEQLAQVAADFQEKVQKPLESVGMKPERTQMETTEERVVIRSRLATSGQLAAHTPRPWALASNLGTFQIHESAVNNVLDQIPFEEKTYNPEELRVFLRQQFSLPEQEQGEQDPELGDDVRFEFAKNDPIRVRIEEEELKLILKLDRLSKGSSVAEDVYVEVGYRPVRDGRNMLLERTDTFRIGFGRASYRSKFVLRAVFTKVFSRSKTLPLLSKTFMEDERWNDLGLVAVDLREGWMGVNLGKVDADTIDSTPKIAKDRTEEEE